MEYKKDTENNLDICLDWTMLDRLNQTGEVSTQDATVYIGKVAAPTAVIFFGNHMHIEADVFLPAGIQAQPPQPGIRNVLAFVPPQRIVADPCIVEARQDNPNADGIDAVRLFATGDTPFKRYR